MSRLIISYICLMFLTGCMKTADTPEPSRGEIALSFDDAPRGNGAFFSGSERTDLLIKALRSVDAPPAVFFVTTKGLNQSKGQDRILKYAEAGHLIANHSDTHPFASRVGLEAMISEIDAAEEKLAGFANRRPWFRFPFLDEGKTQDLRDNIRKALDAREISNGYVTVDNFDWYLASQTKKAVREGRSVDMKALREAYVEMLVQAVRIYDQLTQDGLDQKLPHVLLLHENDLAALFVDDLIVALRQDGWAIISPDEAYSHPVAKKIPSTLNTGSGHFAALSVDAGLSEERLKTWVLDETAIDRFVSEKKVFRDLP